MISNHKDNKGLEAKHEQKYYKSYPKQHFQKVYQEKSSQLRLYETKQ